MDGSPEATAGSPLVVLDQVNKHYGDLHVLNDINLTVDRGEVVIVIGPSGSGKSTLCRSINRLETIDDGTITIDGKALPDEGAPWRGCAPTWAWCSSPSTCSRTRPSSKTSPLAP
ncbi:hypothetical protein GCM10025876_32740 [Demequina litorisediminis]|uniref:ABC transporter domain-containing protein n=1 Tax=Demequina litorisediminis TaxID=1849022 RepID=A0ABQ6IH11_9MICO|nr:hypothetical protein GCM10025876_32740 [Demequina litorisediminis]